MGGASALVDDEHSTARRCQTATEESAMSAQPSAQPVAPEHREPGLRATSPAQLHWLEDELRSWRAEGLVDEVTAASIRSRYVAVRKVTLSRIVLTLGACFFGLGLIWFVASNLDSMSPLIRMILMVVIWLGFVAAAEVHDQCRVICVHLRHEIAERAAALAGEPRVCRGVPAVVLPHGHLLAVGRPGEAPGRDHRTTGRGLFV